jgi:hypothetical protein
LLQRWHSLAPRALGLAVLLLVGLAAGLAAARYGLLVPAATLVGLAAGVLAFFLPWAGLLIAVGLAVLLPFGLVPLRSGVTPSLLELALLGCLGGWLLPPLLRADRRWHLAWPDALVWVLIAWTTFALVLGWDRGVDANALNNHVEFVLALAAFFAVRQLAHAPQRRRQFVAVLLVAAGLAALLGLALRALPDATALDALTRLGPVGYPTSGRVLRYVEDDPAGLERAIGTSVDPNSFGGMLTVAAAVALGEVLACWERDKGTRRQGDKETRGQGDKETRGQGDKGIKRHHNPALPIPVLLAVLSLLLLALYLTYSRAALGGFAVAALFLATVRYRRLWWGILAAVVLAAALVVVLGPAHPVVARFSQGIAFQDLANQMRLVEYADAWAIVQRYPLLGVGFAGAPAADLTLGVSSIYLTIAERMGLSGLAVFLGAVGAAFGRALWLGRHAEDGEAGRRIALLAGVAAALTIGLLDHYFFNPEFPHMAVLLWAALGVAGSEKG